MRHLPFLLGGLVLAAGCKKTVDTKGFEKTIAERVTAMGLSPGKVTCPSGVEAKAGASFDCQVEIEKTTYDLTVSITSVDTEAKRVNMETAWKKGDAVLAKKIATVAPPKLQQALGAEVAVDCGAEPLMFLDADRKAGCKLTAGDKAATLTFAFDDKLEVTGFKIEPALYGSAKLAAILTPTVHEQTGADTKVDCGPDAVVQRSEDGAVWCSIDNGKQAAKIRVAVTPDFGVESWKVAKPDEPDEPDAAEPAE